MSNQATQQDIERIKSGASQNDQIVIAAFAARGIQATPREDVFTYGAWRALGRQVMKGETGVKVQVYIPKRGSKPDGDEGDGDGDKKDGDGDGSKVGKYLKTVTVFHVSQTKPEGEPDPDGRVAPSPAPVDEEVGPGSKPVETTEQKTTRLVEIGLKKYSEGMEALTRERLTNTAKRARQAAYARGEAGALIDAAMIAVYLGETGETEHGKTSFTHIKSFGECVKLARKVKEFGPTSDDPECILYRAASGHWYANHSEPDHSDSQSAARKMAEIKTRIANLSKFDGVDFFPTPQKLAARMVAMAEICKGELVLEPSAGYGAIADEIVKTGATVFCVEQSTKLAEICREKGYPTDDENFLFWRLDPARANVYDAIIMNPPFEDDMLHVQAAYDLLPEFGRLVAIVGEGSFIGRKAERYIPWLEMVHAQIEKLPDNTFMDRTMPVTTGANARLVKIIKG